MTTHDKHVQSVSRAALLLELIAARGEARVAELADELEVHRSTISRLLMTLEAHGLVRQDGERGAYQLGYGLVELAGEVAGGGDIVGIGRPLAAELAGEVGETVNLVVLDGADVVCLDQIIGTSSVTSVNWVGKRSPAHATASGKVLLADMPWSEVAVLLPEPLAALTDRTITSHDALRASLRRVVERGWASVTDEQEDGLTSIAAPICLRSGQATGALAVSGPSFRLTDERLPAVGAATAAAARRIAQRATFLERPRGTQTASGPDGG